MNQSTLERNKAKKMLETLAAEILKNAKTSENAENVLDQLERVPEQVEAIFDTDIPEHLHIQLYKKENGFYAVELSLDPNDPEIQSWIKGCCNNK